MDAATLPLSSEQAASLAALGENFRRQGRTTEALHILAGLVEAAPHMTGPRTGLAQILAELGHYELAQAQLRQLVEMQPDSCLHHFNLALVCMTLARYPEAEMALRRALDLEPALVEAYLNLAVIQIALKRFTEAEESLRQALALAPDFAEAHSNLGCTLHNQERFVEAEISLRRAIELDPSLADAHSNLGCVLNNQERFEAAESSIRQAIALNPSFAPAHGNLAWSLINQARFEEAEISLRETISLKPELQEAHSNLGQFLLRQGRFAEGWIEFEGRGKKPTTNIGIRSAEVTGRLWRGEKLDGKTLFVCVEQGFGDIIQFMRYIPLLKDAGGPIILDLPDALVPLAGQLGDCVSLIPFGSYPETVDLYCPLLSLPGIFGTRLDSIPAAVPYLQPPPDRTDIWRQRLEGLAWPRVGVVWAGNPKHSNDRNRSIPLALFERLFARTDVSFVSLQQVVSEADGQRLAQHACVRALGHLLGDYADTAAALQQLDLVIAVDTSVAHLAGALGRPTWVLLPYLPDWRWMLDRTDSPWYPTVRLFRQSKPKDWESVLDTMAAAISASWLEAGMQPGG